MHQAFSAAAAAPTRLAADDGEDARGTIIYFGLSPPPLFPIKLPSFCHQSALFFVV
jgi:hypothetical protein